MVEQSHFLRQWIERLGVGVGWVWGLGVTYNWWEFDFPWSMYLQNVSIQKFFGILNMGQFSGAWCINNIIFYYFSTLHAWKLYIYLSIEIYFSIKIKKITEVQIKTLHVK